MTLSRRKFLAFGSAAAAAGLTGCGSRSSLGGSDELSMWTWVGSVNDGLIGQAEKAIPGYDGMKLAMTRIGTNYKTKVLTSLAGKSLVPDIVAINDDVATYFPNQDQFVDLKTLGANELEQDFLPWKWKLGITPEGRMMAYPMDTGPTALFYRTDIFQKAGLDSDPAGCGLAPDWDSYIALGKKLKAAVPLAITANITGVFSYAMAQPSKHYIRGRPVHRRPGPHPLGVRSLDQGGQGRSFRERAVRYDGRERRGHQRPAGRVQRCGLVGAARPEERSPRRPRDSGG